MAPVGDSTHQGFCQCTAVSPRRKPSVSCPQPVPRNCVGMLPRPCMIDTTDSSTSCVFSLHEILIQSFYQLDFFSPVGYV
mmetsp:Transcript_708/g.1190  ORF Transcript_708/g.1190 Transcript_708/m.1190 type:complete len:80 (-) Transcript_708:248-487(-)